MNDDFNQKLAEGLANLQKSKKEEAARIGAQAIQEYCQGIKNCCDCQFGNNSCCALLYRAPCEWKL